MKNTATHFHTGVSGRIRFCNIVDSGGKPWNSKSKGEQFTSDGYKASTVDLKPISRLIGKRVELNGCIGIITNVGSTKDKIIPGKYLGDGKYLDNRQLSQFNHLVLVHWKNAVLPGWQPVFTLKLHK